MQRAAAGAPARPRRVARRDDRRRRPGDRARAHPLEPPRVPRLLREHRLGAGDPRRDDGRDPQRERDAVADLARGDGARAGGAGLDAPSWSGFRPGSSGRSPTPRPPRPSRRSRPPARRPASTCATRGHGRPLRLAAAARVRLARGPLVGREGMHRARPGPRRVRRDRHRRAVPDAGRRARSGHRSSDIAAGCRPIAVVATVGTTSSTSIDPVAAVADLCARHGIWLHVDAAYGGAAAVAPELRGVLDGCDRADSIVINPHKWMLTPMDCSLLWTSRPDDLRAAFSLVPEYLRSDQSEARQPDGLRTRAGAPVPRAEAVDGAARLRRRRPGRGDPRARAARAAVRGRGWAEAAGWELLAPVPFSTVNFRHHPDGVDDEAELCAATTPDPAPRSTRLGDVYLSHTELARPLRDPPRDR